MVAAANTTSRVRRALAIMITALVYARVHDHTVSADYYAAMAHIETRLNLAAESGEAGTPLYVDLFTRARLLTLVNRLATPQLGVEMRLDLVAQLRQVLNDRLPEPVAA